MTPMRHELQDLQIVMQQQQVGLIHQQAQVTDAAARAQNAEKEPPDMVRIAATLAARADDGDILDNKARGQPIKYTGKKTVT